MWCPFFLFYNGVLQNDTFCFLNGFKVNVIIFISRSLHKFAFYLVAAIYNFLIVSLWKPKEINSCGQDSPPGCNW